MLKQRLWKQRLGVAALTISALFGLAQTGAARDRDDYRYDRNQYGWGMSPHERQKLEARREKAAREARQRLEREQRRAATSGYYNGGYYDRYNNGAYNRSTNGYYDQYGYWHAYGR